MSNYFFEVLRPGINTTFQDKGRFYMQHLGVTPGGCMDLESFSIANALVEILLIQEFWNLPIKDLC